MYDLPPPKFAQKALNLVIEDWACLRAALTCGRGEGEGAEDSLLGVQRDTASLDAFVYTLLSRLGQKVCIICFVMLSHTHTYTYTCTHTHTHFKQVLDSLLTAMVSKMGPQRDNSEAVEVTEMFLRSVVRVFTICHMEAISIPSSSSLISSTYRRKRCGICEYFLMPFLIISYFSTATLPLFLLSVLRGCSLLWLHWLSNN